jgi:hypothetical protein
MQTPRSEIVPVVFTANATTSTMLVKVVVVHPDVDIVSAISVIEPSASSTAATSPILAPQTVMLWSSSAGNANEKVIALADVMPMSVSDTVTDVTSLLSDVINMPEEAK